jgi:flagellar biosynthesis/type III secretory pathway M-ring protein FliF/YscJ
MEQTIKPIEGITPDALWTFLTVAVGLCALIILGDKVFTVFRNWKKRREEPADKLADEISAKVLEKLEPRFRDIDQKLSNDKATIDGHTRQIESLAKRADGTDTGIKAINRGVLALLNHALHNGNTDELENAQKGINDYLIDR